MPKKKFAALAALLVTAWVLMLGVGDRAGAAAAVRDFGASQQSAIERDQVVAHVLNLRSAVLRRDRVEARLTTWSDFEQQRGRDYQLSPFAPTLPVWVVAVSGEIRPERAKNDKHYPWGVWVFDATRLQPIFMAADRAGSWPEYFNRLADLGVR